MKQQHFEMLRNKKLKSIDIYPFQVVFTFEGGLEVQVTPEIYYHELEGMSVELINPPNPDNATHFE